MGQVIIKSLICNANLPNSAFKSVDSMFFPPVCPLLLHLACLPMLLLLSLNGVLDRPTVPVPVSALAPGSGVAVYAGLVGALLLCVILVLCVGVLAYRRRCRHLHGDITDSSSALTAAFHPGNYKPPRQGVQTLTHTHTQGKLALFFCDVVIVAFKLSPHCAHLHKNTLRQFISLRRRYLYRLMN